jgi:hypothetical protein
VYRPLLEPFLNKRISEQSFGRTVLHIKIDANAKKELDRCNFSHQSEEKEVSSPVRLTCSLYKTNFTIV